MSNNLEDHVFLNSPEFLSEDTAKRLLGRIVSSPHRPLALYTPSLENDISIHSFTEVHYKDFSRMLTDSGLKGALHEDLMNAYLVSGVNLYNHGEVFEYLLEQTEVVNTLNLWKLGLRDNLYLVVGYLSAYGLSYTDDVSVSATVNVSIPLMVSHTGLNFSSSKQTRGEGRCVFAIRYRLIKRKSPLKVWSPLGENIRLATYRPQKPTVGKERDPKSRAPTLFSDGWSGVDKATFHESLMLNNSSNTAGSFAPSRSMEANPDIHRSANELTDLDELTDLLETKDSRELTDTLELMDPLELIDSLESIDLLKADSQSSIANTKTTDVSPVFDWSSPRTTGDTLSTMYGSSKEQLIGSQIPPPSDETDRQSAIYSIANSVSEEVRDNKINRLVNYLAEQSLAVDRSIEFLDDLSATLPELLRSFAIRLGSEPKDENGVYLAAMVFIDQHRKHIISGLKTTLRLAEDVGVEDSAKNSEELWDQKSDISTEDKVDSWIQESLGIDQDNIEDELDRDQSEDDDDIRSEVVLSSNALKWLTERMHRELTKFYPGAK